MSIAIEKELDYVIEKIEVKNIDADSDFNCRGKIAPIDVADLVKSIDTNGLQSPILVHSYNDEEILKTGKTHRLISGFRRFMALKSLGYKIIPCIVREWMPESKARILNLEENLKRKDLNVLQEAKAIEKLKNSGYTREEMANELGVSLGWVQIRCNVLDFPEDIQKEIADGVINQTQIKELYSLPRDKQYEAIRIIKDRKIRGEKNIKIKRSVSSMTKKVRDKSEINKMLEHIIDNLGPSFATRCLAWAAGNISSLELFADIKRKMNINGKYYEIPNEEFS